MDGAEVETNPEELGGEVETASRVRAKAGDSTGTAHDQFKTIESNEGNEQRSLIYGGTKRS